MKFDVNDLLVVPFQNTVFYRFMSISALMRTRTILHRNTIGKNSKIFSSETTGLISMKFGVNDLLVVPFYNTVFYGFMSIGALMRTCTVLHRNTIGENSNVFFSKNTCSILVEFDINGLWVMPFHNTVF